MTLATETAETGSTASAPAPACPNCGALPDGPEAGVAPDPGTESRRWWRLGLALVIAGQSMVFNLGWNTYLDFAGPETAARELGPTGIAVYHGLLIAAAVAVIGLLGGPLLRRTWSSIREARVSVEALFVLSIAGAFVGSLVSTFTGTGDVYYEVVAIVLCVYTFGRIVSERSRERAVASANRLRQCFDRVVALGADGTPTEKPVAELAPGEQVRVAPGGPICVDGTVTDGGGYVSETSLSGEPLPVIRRPGDRVLAGTWSVDGMLTVRPEAGLGERRLDQVLRAVSQARLHPSSLQEQAGRITRWFVPVVTLVSLGTFAGWLVVGPWQEALFNAMAVLLVACPCALGLATPVAVWGGLQRLAQLGLVSRSAQLLDDLARARHIVFDKTGTLSSAELVAVDMAVTPAFQGRRSELRALIAAAEADLPHPLARALSRMAPAVGHDAPRVESLTLQPGRGIEASVRAPGKAPVHLATGEPELLSAPARAALEPLAAAGPAGAVKRRVFVAVDGEPAAVIFLRENLRGEVGRVFARLRRQGLAIRVLTGDPEPAFAEIEGVRMESGLSPAEKEKRIHEIDTHEEPAIFVGDGLNDAPALSRGSAAIAMGGGAGLAHASASGVLLGDQLEALPRAIALARHIRTRVGQNLVFAAGYNTLGMALAAAGLLHPVLAALLMVGSSAWVTARAAQSTQASVD